MVSARKVLGFVSLLVCPHATEGYIMASHLLFAPGAAREPVPSQSSQVLEHTPPRKMANLPVEYLKVCSGAIITGFALKLPQY